MNFSHVNMTKTIRNPLLTISVVAHVAGYGAIYSVRILSSYYEQNWKRIKKEKEERERWTIEAIWISTFYAKLLN